MSQHILVQLEKTKARLLDKKSSLERERAELQSRIETLDASLERLETATEALAQIPGPLLADDDQDDEPEDQFLGTHFDRIEAFLRTVEEPQTINAIAAATGIARNSVSAVLYRTHSAKFRSLDSPNQTQGKLWKLLSEESLSSSDGEIPF